MTDTPKEPQENKEIDAPVEEYIHRDVDEHGNPDDLLTEKEALEIAKADGIEFVDTYEIDGKEFSTRKKAEAYATKNKLDPLDIMQIRKQK